MPDYYLLSDFVLRLDLQIHNASGFLAVNFHILLVSGPAKMCENLDETASQQRPHTVFQMM